MREHAALSLNFMCNISWGGCWAWFRYMCGYTLKCVYKDILIAFGARSRKLPVNGVNMYLVSLDTKFEWNGLRRASYAIHSLVLTKFPLRCGPELYIWLVGLNLCMCVCVCGQFLRFSSATHIWVRLLVLLVSFRLFLLSHITPKIKWRLLFRTFK